LGNFGTFIGTKVEKKSDSQKKNRFFLRYVNYVHYDTLTLRKRKLKKLTTNSHGWTRILRLKRQLGTTKKTTRTTLFLAKERWLALRAFCVSLEVTCYKQASASSFSRYTTDYRQVIISLRKENSALRLSYSEERRFCEAYARRLAHGGYRQLIVES
jgi:hypothetical protein